MTVRILAFVQRYDGEVVNVYYDQRLALFGAPSELLLDDGNYIAGIDKDLALEVLDDAIALCRGGDLAGPL